MEDETPAFDPVAAQLLAEADFRVVRGRYELFTEAIRGLLLAALLAADIKYHSIEARTKDVESYGRKASQRAADDLDQPKYKSPITEITDLAAARVITFFLNDVQLADQAIQAQFEIVERLDKTLQGEEQLGYQSVHYLVRLKSSRTDLPEYAPFVGMIAEIQVRTILQHAWAEIEHDIQYKAVDVLPVEIRRRFLALAGMLEMGDREFQAIASAHEALNVEARELVESGTELDRVELTPDALKAYLDKVYSPDGRVADWSYSWTTRILKKLGFTNIEQLEEAIEPYNDDAVSRVLHGIRQGQLSRLEDVLLASMGELFIHRHPWNTPSSPWFASERRLFLGKLKRAKIEVGTYDPTASPEMIE